MKESELISSILKLFNYRDRNIVVPNGDDCVVFDTGNKKNYYLMTKDDVVENTHFLFSFSKPQEIASKLVRMNVSDVVSMGDSKPLYCLVSGGIDYKRVDNKWIFLFLKALKKELDLWGIKNIGGNLARSEKIFFSLTLLGTVNKRNVVKRKGARKKDLLCTIGYMGNSKAAVDIFLSKKRDQLSKFEKKLVDFFHRPRIYSDEAKIISGYASSMIDNSDGLYKSASILSEMNYLKVIVDAVELKNAVSQELYKWCALNKKDPVEYIINGGEDYNLIFSVSEEDYISVKKKIPYIYKIGYFTSGKGVEIRNYEGKINTFEHF